MKMYKVNIPFERYRFHETKSAKYKGDLTIFSNEFGIIYDWRINFSSLYIDVCTTESIMKERKLRYKRREELLSLIGLKQRTRKVINGKKENDIIELSTSQIREVESYFNDRTKYMSTLKNIVGIIKGNNPTGEFAKPESAEMICSDKKVIKNFLLLIDELTDFNPLDNKGKALNPECYQAEEISIVEFANLNHRIKNSFNYLQLNKSSDEYEHWVNSIKEYVSQFKVRHNEIKKAITRARQKYIFNLSSYNENAFDDFIPNDEGEKAHIYDVWRIKEEAIKLYDKGREAWMKKIAEIEDPNNYIPLDRTIHHHFDSNKITYDLDGNLIPVDERGQELVHNVLERNPHYSKFFKINCTFLNSKRKEYLLRRNKKVLHTQHNS